MTKQQELEAARTRLAAEPAPFKNAFARLREIVKSDKADPNEEELDDNLFAPVAQSTEDDIEDEDEALLEDEDDDDELLFEDDDDDEEDEDDEDDDEDDDEEDGVVKSLKSGRHSQTAAVSAADQAEAHHKVKRAKNTRATDPAANVHGKVAHHFDDLDDDEVDEGDYDFGDDDGDEGDANHTDGSPNLSEVSDPEFEPKKSKRRRRLNGGHKQEGWNTHKSEDEDGDFGTPEAQEQFIEAVMKSGFAQAIDRTPALRELAVMFGAELAIERAVIGEVAKSYEALGDVPAGVEYITESLGIIAAALQKSLAQQDAILARFDTMTKSIDTVSADVALVKSQPATGTSMGVLSVPTFHVDDANNGSITVSKRDIHAAISKSVQAGEIDAEQALGFMSKMDSPMTGIEGVYKMLPEKTRNRIETR